MDANTLLVKLKSDAPDAPVVKLAELTVDALLDRPLGELVTPQLAVHATRVMLSGWLEAPGAVQALGAVVEDVANRLSGDRRTLKDVVARDVRVALRDVVGRPFSPDKRLVLTIIDREPTRDLVRQLLLDAILEFGRKASAPVAGVAKGLGTLARLAGETVKSKTGGIGSLVGAVSGEVERQVEKRAVEFVDAALGGVFGQIADSVSDPRRATEAAELRMAVFDGVMELSFAQLSRELINLDVPGGAEVLRAGLKRWLASAQSDTELLGIAQFALERDKARTAREVLTELGLLEAAKTVGVEQLAARMREVIATKAFADWLAALV